MYDAPIHERIGSEEILARVGPHVILSGEVEARIDSWLVENKDRVPESQRASVRPMLRQAMLKNLVDMKIILVDLQREIPEEGVKNIRGQVNKAFDEKQIPALMKQYDVKTRKDLLAKLAEQGSSLAQKRAEFIDEALSKNWMSQQIKETGEDVGLNELLAYYNENRSEYEIPAKARWEQLTVKFERYVDKRESRAKLAAMGNAVLDGKPFGQVARESSQGVMADEGGQHDWTSQGSLRSSELDRAIFSLSPGVMSRMIEDEEGVHIVRVLERRAGGMRPFLDEQAAIRDKVLDQRRKERYKKLIAKMRGRTSVWTVYDDQPSETNPAEADSPSGPNRR